MELRHARYFVTVAEEESFTRAAERLRVAQSPISQQIRRLERRLGVKLFERTTRSVVITEAGKIFYDHCVRLLEASEAAMEAARKAESGELGNLALGFTGAAIYDLMPHFVRAYRERYPEVDIELHTDLLTPAQEEALSNGIISVGLLRPPVQAAGIVVEQVRDEPLVVVLPVQHPLATRSIVDLKDLAEESFIAFDASSTMHSVFAEACEQAGFAPHIAQHVANTSTLVALVAAGLGVALAPESVRKLRISSVTYRPLRSPSPTVGLALAYRDSEKSPLVRHYLETVRTVLRSRKLLDSPVDESKTLEFYLDTI